MYAVEAVSANLHNFLQLIKLIIFIPSSKSSKLPVSIKNA